jgi:hypothetical protein
MLSQDHMAYAIQVPDPVCSTSYKGFSAGGSRCFRSRPRSQPREISTVGNGKSVTVRVSPVAHNRSTFNMCHAQVAINDSFSELNVCGSYVPDR